MIENIAIIGMIPLGIMLGVIFHLLSYEEFSE